MNWVWRGYKERKRRSGGENQFKMADNTVRAISDSKPTLKLLQNHVIPFVAAKWNEMGIQLFDESRQHELKNIEDDYNDTKKRCLKMFEVWLETHINPTWQQIMEALKSPGVELQSLAADLEEKLTVTAGTTHIIYSIEDSDDVYDLSELLRAFGIPCDIDQYHSHENIIDWGIWHERMITKCAEDCGFVLLVCSAKMHAQLSKNESSWIQMKCGHIDSLSLNSLIREEQTTSCIIPVCLKDLQRENIPKFLTGRSCYHLSLDKLDFVVDPEMILSLPHFESLRSLVYRLKKLPEVERTPIASEVHHSTKGRQTPPINRRTVFAYQEAFKKGKRAANKFKIVMLGAEGAGKTSTVYSLLNKAFQHQQQSTIGADINTCTADRFFTAKWKQIGMQHHLEDLPKRLTSKLKSLMLHLPKKDLEQTSDIPVVSKKIKTELKEPHENFPQEVISHEMAAKVQAVVDAQESHDDGIQIIILDLGGQEIYYHIHFLFLAEEDVVFIAFNASKDLDQPVVCRQRLTRFQKKVETRGMQTNLQAIETSMESVYSHCGKVVDSRLYISNRIPTIVLIATHSKDLSPQQKSAIVRKLYEAFNGRPFMDHLPRFIKEAIFFIDNSARDPQVFEVLKSVVLKAAAPTIRKECPISYLQFEIDVLKESQSKAVISKQEALAIAEKASLQDSLREVLDHYTLKGTLLYYPEVESLQNKVFISPQEVSDLVSSVITTHNCEPSSAKLQQVCDRYDQFGLLEEDLLDDMLHIAGRYKDKNTILGFLEKFHLAVEMSRDTKLDNEKESYTTPKSGRVFLVPSMLVYNPKAVPIAREGNIILIYHFPDLFVPENIFNEVLVRIASWCNLRGHHVHSIFHGVGCFHCQGRKQSFKLLHCLRSCSIKCFITIYQHNLPSDVLDTMLHQRQQLRHHLEVCIEEAHRSHIPCARPPIGYLECPLHAPEESCPPHIRLDQLTPFGEVTCPRSVDCEVVPREAYALLFVSSLTTTTEVGAATQITQGTVRISQIEDKEKVPEMKDLHRYVISTYAPEWRGIGLELNLKATALDIIAQDNPLNCIACFERTLDKWLKSNPHATWKILEVAISNARRAYLGVNSVTDVAIWLVYCMQFTTWYS